MEYHEIGERFEYDGVVLEVVKFDTSDDCPFCYFFNKKCPTSELACGGDLRLDKKKCNIQTRRTM